MITAARVCAAMVFTGTVGAVVFFTLASMRIRKSSTHFMALDVDFACSTVNGYATQSAL
jgi:hypothetical protein